MGRLNNHQNTHIYRHNITLHDIMNEGCQSVIVVVRFGCLNLEYTLLWMCIGTVTPLQWLPPLEGEFHAERSSHGQSTELGQH